MLWRVDFKRSPSEQKREIFTFVLFFSNGDDKEKHSEPRWKKCYATFSHNEISLSPISNLAACNCSAQHGSRKSFTWSIFCHNWMIFFPFSGFARKRQSAKWECHSLYQKWDKRHSLPTFLFRRFFHPFSSRSLYLCLHNSNIERGKRLIVSNLDRCLVSLFFSQCWTLARAIFPFRHVKILKSKAKVKLTFLFYLFLMSASLNFCIIVRIERERRSEAHGNEIKSNREDKKELNNVYRNFVFDSTAYCACGWTLSFCFTSFFFM